MPKKYLQASVSLSQQTQAIKEQLRRAEVARADSSNVIAEMHVQNGMTSFKQDLQRKIHNY